MRKALPSLAALLLAAGCGGGSEPPRERERGAPPPARAAVSGELELPEAGAGQHAGDSGVSRGGLRRYEARTPDGETLIPGRVEPPDAEVTVQRAGARPVTVAVGDGGRFAARVAGLRRGTTRFTVTATVPGREPWRALVLVVRDPRASASVRVPRRDPTAPYAFVRRIDAGRVVHAVARDADSGITRVRVTVEGQVVCRRGGRRFTLPLTRNVPPPFEPPDRVRAMPGHPLPIEASRRVGLVDDDGWCARRGGRLVRVRGRLWADATSGADHEASSAAMRFSVGA